MVTQPRTLCDVPSEEVLPGMQRIKHAGHGAILLSILVAATIGLNAGCAGPPPRLFPIVPLCTQDTPSGGTDRVYDTNGDGKPDYHERLSSDGIITTIGYDTNGDGEIDEEIDIAAIPEKEHRHLILVLDSIPFAMVQEAWFQGRLRFFGPPTRVVSTFPVMTDLALAELFNISPTPGIESEYFDGQQLSNGYLVYANKGNAPWHDYVDWRLEPIMHASAYLSPQAWYDHELRIVQDTFNASTRDKFTAYFVGTSAIGARIGRTGHHMGLVRLDRFCQELMHKTRGRVRFTLLSDHGHNMAISQRVPLSDVLRQLSYRTSRTLEKPYDVVVPEFGMVTCAAIHTDTPDTVARDVVSIEGIELSAYLDARHDEVVVLSRDGRARISHSSSGLRYQPEFGDPLAMLPILDKLAQAGSIDPQGFADDHALFQATVDHAYPDAVYRLWRAFHGLVVNTPQILVSVQDGYHCGSPTQSSLIRLTAAHGNLRPMSSLGFAMTMAGQLPPAIRMANLGKALQDMGVPLNRKISGENTPPHAQPQTSRH